MLPAKTSEVAAKDLGALNSLPLPPPVGLPLFAAGAGADAAAAGALGVCIGADGAGA